MDSDNNNYTSISIETQNENNISNTEHEQIKKIIIDLENKINMLCIECVEYVEIKKLIDDLKNKIDVLNNICINLENNYSILTNTCKRLSESNRSTRINEAARRTRQRNLK